MLLVLGIVTLLHLGAVNHCFVLSGTRRLESGKRSFAVSSLNPTPVTGRERNGCS